MSSVKAVPGEVCLVDKIPDCDFCEEPTPGPYDFASIFSCWAHGCAEHYNEYRASEGLGVGKAQLWVVSDGG